MPRAPINRLAARTARRVRDDERGMTLIEMMVGLFMGTVVMLAAYTAIDAANRSQLRTEMRIEAVNRGRNAMEDVTRSIRAQQCFNGTRPMLWAAGTAMEFYSSIAPISSSTFQPVERHRIVWEPQPTPVQISNGGEPVGNIVQYIWRQNPSSGAWSTQPVRKTLATMVERAPDRRNKDVRAPIFRYYRYSAATGSGRVDYSSPIAMSTTQNGLPSAAGGDLAGIVLIEVSYRVTPRSTRSARSEPVNFHNTISVRIADPTNPGGSPQCL